MENNRQELQNNPVERRAIQARIVRFACILLGLAVVAIIAGWALTGTLTDWETVVAGVILCMVLVGLSLLARRGHAGLAAGLLSGLLFVLVAADTTYYGLGSPSAVALLLPVLLIACTLGFKPGLAAAGVATLFVFGIAWAGFTGYLATEIPTVESHLSFNAPLISVILLFAAALVGYAIEHYQRPGLHPGQPE